MSEKTEMKSRDAMIASLFFCIQFPIFASSNKKKSEFSVILSCFLHLKVKRTKQ